MNNKPLIDVLNVFRIFAAFIALVLTYLAFLGVRTSLQSGNVFSIFLDDIDLSFITAAVFCWWFALRRQVSKERWVLLFAYIGALCLCGIGFIIGFFGPMIFSPESNRGSLLGIFVTGPLGFAVGAWLGAAVGALVIYFRKRTESEYPK